MTFVLVIVYVLSFFYQIVISQHRSTEVDNYNNGYHERLIA